MKNLILSLLLLAGLNTSTLAQGVNLEYRDDTTKLRGYYVPSAVPPRSADGKLSDKPKPAGIVIIHAWMGITAHEKASAEQLGKLGYNVLAADIYGENIHPQNTLEASTQAGFYKKHYKIYHTRIKAAIDALVKQGTDPDKIVIMGYCFGGTGAIEAARAGMPVKGVISFHGGLGKDTNRTNIAVKPRVLVLHGADDPFVNEKEVKNFQQEMRDAKADWQMVYYSNAVHSFTDPAAGNDNSKGAAYNKDADERSWRMMLTFLQEVFGKQ